MNTKPLSRIRAERVIDLRGEQTFPTCKALVLSEAADFPEI